jgi:cell division septation protein DedD
VSDTHHDAQATDEGFHEIQLSGKELVFLFMMTTIVAVVIFLCGVQVGRNVQTGSPADTAASAAPTAAEVPSQPQAVAGPPAAEPPAPAAEPQDELSYARRLQADSAPAEKLKAPPPSAAATPAPAGPPAPKAAASGRPGPWIVQLTALQDRGAAAAIARRLAAKGYPAFVLDPPAGSPALYRVQVGGYADRAVADQAARRLEKEEQFKAYVRSR